MELPGGVAIILCGFATEPARAQAGRAMSPNATAGGGGAPTALGGTALGLERNNGADCVTMHQS